METREANVLHFLRPLPWAQPGLKFNLTHLFLIPAPDNSFLPCRDGWWWVHGPHGLAPKIGSL